MKILYRLLIFLLIFGLSSAYAQTPAPAKDSKEKITIAQFGKERFLLYLPLYVAMEEGIFTKHGLTVDLKFAGNDDQIFAAVISGAAQIGVGDPVFTAISHDKGGPGKVVAMMLTNLGVGGVAIDPKVPMIKTPDNLDGLRIGSLPEPSTTYTLLSGVKKHYGLNLQIVQAPIDGQAALVEAGKVDIAVVLEPDASILEDKGFRRVFDLAKWTDPQVITGFTATEDFIKAHPETIQKVVDSLQEALNIIYKDPQVAYRTGKKLYPNLSDKVVHTAVDHMLSENMYPHSAIVPDELWQRTLKTRLDSDELKKPQATTIAVDNSFAIQAGKDVGVAAP